MRVISVNVGLPRSIPWHGRTVTTGIFKEPVSGQVPMRRLNLDGDRQADLSVHGGPDKAVYVYPAENYPFWRGELPEHDLGWGGFGENLTTEGWLEDGVHIGDRFRIGTAEVIVTQPRMPCYKLGIRFGREDIVPRFLAAGRPGFYLRVLEEGEVGAGDAMVRTAEDPVRIPVSEVYRLGTGHPTSADRDLLERITWLEALPDSWREHFRRLLE